MSRMEPNYPAPDSGTYKYMRETCYLGPEWWATEYRYQARYNRQQAHRAFRRGSKWQGMDYMHTALIAWQNMRKELEKIEKGYW